MFAAATYDADSIPFQLITVGTGADVTISTTEHPIKIIHLGLQDDGTTASASTDRLWIGHSADTLTATIADGNKIVLLPGGSCEIQGKDIKRSADGSHVLRLRSTGNECKVQLIRGR